LNVSNANPPARSVVAQNDTRHETAVPDRTV
jgi:hypothetical protein